MDGWFATVHDCDTTDRNLHPQSCLWLGNKSTLSKVLEIWFGVNINKNIVSDATELFVNKYRPQSFPDLILMLSASKHEHQKFYNAEVNTVLLSWYQRSLSLCFINYCNLAIIYNFIFLNRFGLDLLI